MRVTVITPPEPVVTWPELDAHLLLAGDTSQRTYVEALAAAATAHIDGPTGWLGRAIGEQELEARFDSFGDCGVLQLPCPEILDVVSVEYVDAAGAVQTAPGVDYEQRGRIVAPIFGKTWPQARHHPESVRVRYFAGYGDTIPAPIKAAILLMVGDLFAFRETVVTGTIMASVPMTTTVERLLAPFRVYA